MKYIFIMSGVVSSLGKSIISGSIGLLLQNAGFNVTYIKCDTYVNTEIGIMNPQECGEIYLLDDGTRVHSDLGVYERMVNVNLSSYHHMTIGKVYKNILTKEHRGDFLGKTIQVIPCVTLEIQNWIEQVSLLASGDPNICIIELGGIVGDIDHQIFTEAIRQFQFRATRKNLCFIYITFVPQLKDQKTKLTQNSLIALRTLGIDPDIMICRAENPITPKTNAKLVSTCRIPESHIFSCHDIDNLYRIPIILYEQGIINIITQVLSIDVPKVSTLLNIATLQHFAKRVDSRQKLKPAAALRIGIISKYMNKNAYLSIEHAVRHAEYYINGPKIIIEWITPIFDPTQLNLHGIIMPDEDHNIDERMLITQYARENLIPFLGICAGFQIAIVEYIRNVVKWPATSAMWDSDEEHNITVKLPRIGTHEITLHHDSISYKLYQTTSIYERHHHVYNVDLHFADYVVDHALNFVGESIYDSADPYQEIVEIRGHPFFIATQFHPQMKSRPLHPAPLFVGLLRAAEKNQTAIPQKVIK